ncbi:MAG: patatin-like phospholipase family protein [archaeon]
MKIGLALGSGGARGLAHIGVIKVLKKEGIKIDYISGTSIGSLVGAYYALNQDVSGLEEIALSFTKRSLINFMDFNNPKISLIKGEKIKSFLFQLFGDKTFADTKIKLKIGATSLQDGSEVIISSGKLRDAVAASGSLPFFFPPQKYRGAHLIDGGIVDATPIKIVKDMGAKAIIAVNLFGKTKRKIEDFTLIRQLEKVYEILLSSSVKYQIRPRDRIVMLEPNTGNSFQLFAFDDAKRLIAIGQNETRKKMKKIKAMLK